MTGNQGNQRVDNIDAILGRTFGASEGVGMDQSETAMMSQSPS